MRQVTRLFAGTVVAVIALSTIAAAAPLSKKQWLQQGNAVCKTVNEGVNVAANSAFAGLGKNDRPSGAAHLALVQGSSSRVQGRHRRARRAGRAEVADGRCQEVRDGGFSKHREDRSRPVDPRGQGRSIREGEQDRQEDRLEDLRQQQLSRSLTTRGAPGPFAGAPASRSYEPDARASTDARTFTSRSECRLL